MSPQKVYARLLISYGPQGWWPLLNCKEKNSLKSGKLNEYHPGNYEYPKNDQERFEICVGAILTQNTTWRNVEKALLNLQKANFLCAKTLLDSSDINLQDAIRSAGYFNQKAKKLKIFAEFYTSLRGVIPTREQLLGVWGIGQETADSILLYAYRQPVFVIDAYTKRIFSRLAGMDEHSSYQEWQAFFVNCLPHDARLFNEYHALIVEHAKRYCTKTPQCTQCPLKKTCKMGEGVSKKTILHTTKL